jgi:hypothetical protein
MSALGSVQTVIICIPGTGNQGVCPDGYTQSVTQAYLVSPSSASILDSGATPFDAVQAAEYWGASFTLTIWLYLFALGCGTIYRKITGL